MPDDDRQDVTPRGRPRDPAVDGAVIAATLALLAERGHDALRVVDVAERAGTGLGAVYRRWPTKRALVIAALESLAGDDQPAPTDDPRADLLASLEAMAAAIAGPQAGAIAAILVGPDAELAAALRAAKLDPLRVALRERLRRVIGDAPDLDVRAQIGPALITYRALVLRQRVTRADVREQILPLLLGPVSRQAKQP